MTVACPQCGGPLLLRTGQGRTLFYLPNVPDLPIGDHHELLTCDDCGELILSDEDEAAVAPDLERAWFDRIHADLLRGMKRWGLVP